jgi:hypothetical protein
MQRFIFSINLYYKEYSSVIVIVFKKIRTWISLYGNLLISHLLNLIIIIYAKQILKYSGDGLILILYFISCHRHEL